MRRPALGVEQKRKLRAFLRFPASGGEIQTGLDTQIDTPRVYRGEKLPRALPWDTVREFLQAIDRTSLLGRRDYAIFLLMATYGLRACEVVTLTTVVVKFGDAAADA